MKKFLSPGLIVVLLMMLAACATQQNAAEEAKTTESETRTIQYPGKEYTVSAKVERPVITGSMESKEDAIMLDGKPVGAMTVGGKFPEIFAPVTEFRWGQHRLCRFDGTERSRDGWWACATSVYCPLVELSGCFWSLR